LLGAACGVAHKLLLMQAALFVSVHMLPSARGRCDAASQWHECRRTLPLLLLAVAAPFRVQCLATHIDVHALAILM